MASVVSNLGGSGSNDNTDDARDISNIDNTPDESSFPNNKELQKQEEAKLTARYPQAQKPMAGHSAFLQKRLAKGQKYFDSGDYQMAKQMGKNVFQGKPKMMPPILAVAPEIPTAESIPHPHRKPSLVQPQSKLANSDN